MLVPSLFGGVSPASPYRDYILAPVIFCVSALVAQSFRPTLGRFNLAKRVFVYRKTTFNTNYGDSNHVCKKMNISMLLVYFSQYLINNLHFNNVLIYIN